MSIRPQPASSAHIQDPVFRLLVVERGIPDPRVLTRLVFGELVTPTANVEGALVAASLGASSNEPQSVTLPVVALSTVEGLLREETLKDSAGSL